MGGVLLPSACSFGVWANDKLLNISNKNFAAVANKQYFFRSNPKSLREVLRYYSRVTGIQYFYTEPGIGFLKVGRISGRLAIGEALEKTLKGTGYEYAFTDASTVIIFRPKPSQKMVTHTAKEVPEEFIPKLGNQHIHEVHISAPRTTALGFKKISPTVVVEGLDLERRGVINVAKALYEAPFINASVSEENTTFTEFGAGTNMLDLRNLGVSRTLVVVNGRRHVPSNGGSTNLLAVDLNMLPPGMVKRIEVLTTGASVLYGADALGGLVNVTLRDDFEGVELSALGNLSQKGDNQRINLGAGFGMSMGDGTLRYNAFVNFQKYNGLKARDRFITSDPAGHAVGGQPSGALDGAVLTRGFGRSSTSASGSIWGYASPDGGFRTFDGFFRIALGEDGQPLGEFTGTPDQLYNYAADSDLAVPIETAVFSGSMTVNLGDDHQLFFEHTFGRSSVYRELAPTPLFGLGGQGILVPVDNPFIPDELSDEVIAEVGDEILGLYVTRRVVELGNRTNKITRALFRAAVGFEGQLWEKVDYSLHYQYGNSINITAGTNAIDSRRVEASVSPELCALESSRGCSLVNFFGSNTITAEQASYLRVNYRNETSNNQHIIALELRGDVATLPAGPISMIAGAHYRKEESAANPDRLVQQGRIGSLAASQPSSGDFDVMEGYLATTVPLLEDSIIGDRLTLDAGIRFSHFSTSKGAVSWQIGAEYQPISSLSFRASYQEANRAPNVAELFFAPNFSEVFYIDPCNNVENEDPNSALVVNCRASGPLGGISEGFNQGSVLVEGQYSGNHTLAAEQAYTGNVGVTFKPELAEKHGDFHLSFDWFSIRVEGVIQGQIFNEVLSQCYNSTNLEHIYCGINPANGRPFFIRDPESREIKNVNVSNWNDGTYNVKGFDAELVYSQSLENLGLPAGWGSFRFRLLYSYNLKSELSAVFSGAQEFRGNISQPYNRLLMNLTYENGPWNFNWVSSYRGAGRVNLGLSESLDGNQAPSFFYHNFSANYQVGSRLNVQFGVDNVFNVAPPFLAYNISNTFPEYYDVVGRRFFLGFKTKF